jgi:ATP diphosphatase
MTSVDALLELMARLRDPKDGCPWDVEQTFETIAPYTLEEAYEVDHAIQQGDMVELCDELGDLLLQVVFHAQMADEAGHFAFPDVVTAICDKLVRRHPHVFASEEGPVVHRTADEQTRSWEEIKTSERAARSARHGAADGPADPFEGIPTALPALSRAAKLRKRAANVGAVNSMPDVADPQNARKQIDVILTRIDEASQGEVVDAERPGDGGREAELGRLLAACVDLSRALDVDPELALRQANRDYEARIRARVAERER